VRAAVEGQNEKMEIDEYSRGIQKERTRKQALFPLDQQIQREQLFHSFFFVRTSLPPNPAPGLHTSGCCFSRQENPATVSACNRTIKLFFQHTRRKCVCRQLVVHVCVSASTIGGGERWPRMLMGARHFGKFLARGGTFEILTGRMDHVDSRRW